MTALADDAGIDSRSKAGIPHDLFEIVSKKGMLSQVTYIEFVVIMLTLIVRSYMGKRDYNTVEELDECYNKYFNQMTTAERLFYSLLKFRLGEVMFESDKTIDNTPVKLAVIGYGEPELIEANKKAHLSNMYRD